MRQCLLFLEAVLNICQTTVPLTIRLKYAQFIQPSLQQSIAAPNAISCLTLSIVGLGTYEMRRNFQLGSTATKFDLCDVVKKEFR